MALSHFGTRFPSPVSDRRVVARALVRKILEKTSAEGFSASLALLLVLDKLATQSATAIEKALQIVPTVPFDHLLR
jgi:hypothetical protein